jgi:hemerythrin
MSPEFEPIEWEKEMSTGVEDIDRQHRFLIDTLQDANKALSGSDDAVLLNEVAKLLLGYAITHFETEEALMKRYGYAEEFPDQAGKHIAHHRSFSQKIVTLIEQLHEGKQVSHAEVQIFLNTWLRDHVLGIDRELGRFLRSRMDRFSANRP